jgi:hypothetical protein
MVQQQELGASVGTSSSQSRSDRSIFDLALSMKSIGYSSSADKVGEAGNVCSGRTQCNTAVVID